MTPIQQNLTMYRNDDPARWRFNISVGGVPLDMSSGYSGLMQVRDYPGADGSELFEIPTGTGGVSKIDFDATGWDLVIFKTKLAGVPDGPEPGADYEAYYDILITDPAGDTNPWYVGKFIIKEGVTVP